MTAPDRVGPPVGAGTRRADHVVLVVWDGFDARYRHRAPTPHLDGLSRRGVITTGEGVMQSITNPSMASLATGTYPERHLNSAYVYDEVSGTVRGQTRKMAVETVAETLRAQDRTVAAIQWFILHGRGVSEGDPRALYTRPGGNCRHRVDQFVDLMAGRPVRSGDRLVTVPEIPDLSVVYCHDLDSLGHRLGAENRWIGRRLTAMDRQLGRIVQATRDAGSYSRTAFLVVGDHGMTTYRRSFGRALLAAISRVGLAGRFVGIGGTPAPGTDVAIVVGGGAGLYLRDGTVPPDTLARLRESVERIPQVLQVLGRAEQRSLRMAPTVGQLLVEPRPGWTAGPAVPFLPAGRHGSTTELHTTLLLAGAGVRPGALLHAPRHVDVAPTVCALLGAEPPAGAQGRVLTEALR